PYVEVALQAPPSPDYIRGPEEPEQAPPSPDYVPGPEHADDEIVAEDQLYAEDASPTAQSPEPLAMSSPPSSPLSPWSSPPPQIPFPPLPLILSPPLPVSDAPSSGTPLLLPISAPTSSPPLQLPSASRREDRPKVTLPPRKRLGIAHGPGYEIGESSSAAVSRLAGGLRADYGFVATIDREIMRDPERVVGYRITDSVRRDMDEIYMRLDDEQSERQLLAGRLNMLFRDRRAHTYTRHLMETEARLSREAWVRSTDASDLVRGEVMSLRTTVLGQMTEIRELHAADRRRHIVISEMLRADHRRSTKIIGLRT
nr:hypothetical protein [Tanacetum cinerariifolium]